MAQENIWYKNKFLWLILGLGLLIRLIFIFHPPQILFDAKDYDALGKSLSEGKGFNIEGVKNTPYLGIRAPGYPLFLGAVYWLFGYSHLAVYGIQILMDLGIIIFLYLFLDKLFPQRNYKYVVAFFWSINLMSTYYSVSILSETLYLSLFVIALYLFYVRVCLERQYNYLVLLSLILGYASLIKSFLIHIYVLLIIFLVVLYILSKKRARFGETFRRMCFREFDGTRKKSVSSKRFTGILLLSITLFILLSSAFMIRNYYLFKEPVNYGIGSSLAFTGGNPNMFTMEDYAHLESLIMDEYKNFTPIQALRNSEQVNLYFREKVREHPKIFLSNSIIRASLFWFEPFAVRSVFIIDGKESSFDKAYAPSVNFILNYGPIGFFKGLSFTLLLFVVAIFLFWILFLIMAFYGLYLLFFKYKKNFLAISILLLCLYFTGIYALTVVVPRYFIQNILLLSIPFAVGITELFLKFIKFKSFKKTRLFLKSIFGEE